MRDRKFEACSCKKVIPTFSLFALTGSRSAVFSCPNRIDPQELWLCTFPLQGIARPQIYLGMPQRGIMEPQISKKPFQSHSFLFELPREEAIEVGNCGVSTTPEFAMSLMAMLTSFSIPRLTKRWPSPRHKVPLSKYSWQRSKSSSSQILQW